MDNICDKCGSDINAYRSKEEYLNIYGTYCPKCGSFVESSKEPEFVIKYRNKLEKLRLEFLEILKKRFKKE